MALYFKHCSFPDPERWGALGLPSTQGPPSIQKRYTEDGAVLLALTVSAGGPLAGRIFAVCTIDRVVRQSTGAMNPEVGGAAQGRWGWCVPIRRMWRVRPRTYLDIAGGELAHRAMIERGRLFRLPRASEAELERWYLEEEPREVEVFRPRATQEDE
jgi:hypothetical protein